MHYKTIACIGKLEGARPLIWSAEFDDKAAAEQAAAFLRTWHFNATVIPDPEEGDEAQADDTHLPPAPHLPPASDSATPLP